MAKQRSLSKKELEEYREKLLVLRKKIVVDLKHLEEGTLNTNQKESSGDLSGYSIHMADQATDNFDREFTIGLASNEQKLLNAIDLALKRVDDGSFGICERTGTLISKKRLEAMPYARLSKKAQEEEEKERHKRS